MVERLGQAAAAAAPGEWVTGKSFDPSLYPGEPNLTAAILDRIAPSNPVLVANASMHFVYANSAALARAHVTAQTPDPPGGRYLRANGALTGAVSEMSAMMPVLSAVPQLSHEELLDGLVGILARAASQGITKVHEAGTGALFGASELDILHGLAASGRLSARITTAQLDAERAAWEKAGLRPGDGNEMVRAVSWKAICDGSNQGRTGYQRQPYLGSADRGAANCTADELEEVVRYAHDRGWQLMVHANGDAALDLTVGAYEKALAGASTRDLRHRIEHCSIADDEHFRVMAELGISPSFLMNHVYYWGSALRDHILGPDRAHRLDSVASALRHGLRPSFHSDYSVSPMSPLLAVQTAVTRSTRDGSVLNPAEGIDVMSALRAMMACSFSVHSALHPDGHDQADDDDQDDAQDHRRPAEYQARERQASPLFSGVPDLVPGHVAEHDRRDARQRPEHELREPAGEARYREPVDLGHRGHRSRPRGRQVGHELVQIGVGARGKGVLQAAVILVPGQPAFAVGRVEEFHYAVAVRVGGPHLLPFATSGERLGAADGLDHAGHGRS